MPILNLIDMKKKYFSFSENFEKKIKTCLSIVAFLLATGLLFAQTNPIPAKGRILVKPADGVSAQEFNNIISAHGHSIQHNPYINLHVIEVPENAEDAIITALSHNPKIQFAERDMLLPPCIVPNDPQFGSQWHHTVMQTPAAWNISKGAGIKIGIMDSGIDTAHVDLKNKIVLTWNATGNTTNSADVPDYVGHGTKVAGTAAASTDNTIGVAGVAWASSLIVVKVDANNDGNIVYWSTLANGITFAANNGARVVNASYQASTSSSVITAAQYLKNLTKGLMVCSAGNSATSFANDVPDIITVSATTSSDAFASYSNSGSQIDVAAPGSGILTTVAGGGYGSVNGTSFSAPNTAGVIALIMAADPTLSAAQVETILKTTADDLGTPGYDTLFGYGRINAYKAVKAAAGCGVTINPSSAGICKGSSVTLTASGGVGKYTWTPSTALNVTTGNIVIASPTVTTTYTVSDSTGCTRPVIITVTSTPLVSVNPVNSQICSGTSVTLTAGGANTYSWAPSTGLSATIGITVNANPTTTTTYTVTGSTNGCTAQSTSTITVNPGTAPNVVLTASATSICSGSNSTLTASGATGGYNWAPSTGLSATSGSTVTATPTTTTTYTVTGVNGSCSASAIVTITVSGTAPTISVSPTSSNLCSGSVNLTASGPGGTTFSWSPSAGLNVTTGKNVTANPSVTTTYTVTGTKGSCFNTASALVALCPLDVQEIINETAVSVYPNPSANTFNVRVNNVNGTEVKIVLYNTLGETIFQMKNVTEEFSINVSGIPQGLYFIAAFAEDKMIGRNKCILNR
jgi:thermitase